MILRDLMTRDPVCITEDVTLQDAAKLMKKADIGFLPVVEGSRDEPSRTPLGVVTDRDLVLRGMAEGADPRIVKVAGVFTRETVFAYDDTTASEALEHMQRNHIGRLLVANRNDVLVGVVTLAQVAAHAEDTTRPDKILATHQA